MQVLCEDARQDDAVFAQKEVIQPHLPIRLPCYDFTPVIGHTVASALPKVKLPASGATNSHGVTGGVYKARERIHRSNADLRVLAIPTSWSRAYRRRLAALCPYHCSTCVALAVRAMMT